MCVKGNRYRGTKIRRRSALMQILLPVCAVCFLRILTLKVKSEKDWTGWKWKDGSKTVPILCSKRECSSREHSKPSHTISNLPSPRWLRMADFIPSSISTPKPTPVGALSIHQWHSCHPTCGTSLCLTKV